MLLDILSASGSMDNFAICVLGYLFSDSIGSIMVDSVFLDYFSVLVAGALDKANTGQLDLDLLLPCCGYCSTLTISCDSGEENDNEKMWDVLWTT
jgi:hypothetical protein